MVDFKMKDKYGFEDLLNIMTILRSPGGCVWDAEQTHETIRRDFLEETYEVCQAIDDKSTEDLCEELGDVLLQVVFHTEIEREAGRFDIDDVCDGVCKKMIYRHPHVFADTQVANSAEVIENWDALKRVEKSQATETDALVSVARALPALRRAEKVQHKAAKAGVKQTSQQAIDNVAAACAKLQANPDDIGANLGNLLFACVGLAEASGRLDCEVLLHDATDRFVDRFEQAEQACLENNSSIRELSTEDSLHLLHAENA